MRYVLLSVLMVACGSSEPSQKTEGAGAEAELPMECERYLELSRACTREISPDDHAEGMAKIDALEAAMKRQLREGTPVEKARTKCGEATGKIKEELGPACPSVQWP